MSRERSRALFLLNPRAGGGRAAARLGALLRRAPPFEGRYDVAEVTSVDDACRAMRVLEPGVVPVAAGGDGTLGLVAAALDRRGGDETALAVLPLGTGNILARTLGVDTPVHALAALEHGPVRRIDVMRTSHPAAPLALVSISAGFEGRFIERYAQRRRLGRGVAALTALWSALGRGAPPMLELEGENVLGAGDEVFSAGLYNTPFYAGGLVMSPDADVADGAGEVAVYRTALAYVRATAAALGRSSRRSGADVLRRRFGVARLESAGPLQIDGEPVAAGAVSVRMQPGALSVIAAGVAGEPVASCGVRDTLRFLRDPARFTAGPGLGLGDLYRVPRPGRRLHVVTDLALVEQILVGQAACFEKSRIYWHELRRSMGECLGTLEGDAWEYLHEAERPFFTPDAARRYLPALDEQVLRHLRGLVDRPEAPPEVPLLASFAELYARTLVQVLFGQEDEPASLEIARRIADGHAIIAWQSKFPWRRATGWLRGVNRRADRHRQWLDSYAARLEESTAASDPRLLLHALLRAPLDEAAPRLPDSLLRNEVTFHLGAGTETLAAATAWTLYLLGEHPEALGRLREEIARVAGRAPVSSGHLEALAYAKQVAQEALRLYPPVYAILRDCVRPARLGTYAARAGDTLLISVCGLHRNPRLWSEPDRFRPERFSPDQAGAISRHQYLPFGAGRHVCIGRHVAMPALVLTVAQFAQQFDWELLDRDIQPIATSSLKPSGALRARLTRRPAFAPAP